ncbi:hypothetical protein DY218_03130 [Streptomyces triticagri]|uniref:PQQ-binding-like beta-propeller repeat protein n=1 Tax=Streptomyces triticagri TaxID=2293568 RepID=A0A372MCK3_9ACTN|nr:hypothetical protein DY218_03130 [Streptomyces triticagri]
MGGAGVVVVAVIAATVWAWGGPDGGGGGDDAKKPAPPRVLKAAWQQTDYEGTPRRLPWWNIRDLFVDRLGDGVQGLDARTGEGRWKLRLPSGARSLCTLSDEVNADGIGAALLRPVDAEEGRCTLAAAVDAKTGRWLWTAPLDADHEPGDSGPPGTTHSVAAGSAVLTFNSRTGPVRFTPGGRRLDPLLPKDDDCTVSAPSSEVGARYALLTRHCPTEAGSDRKKPADKRMLYDLESGERLTDGNRAGTIVSEDPLVLLRTERGAQFSHLDTYDASGRPLRRIRLPDNALVGRPDAVHFADGVAVVPTAGSIRGLTVGTAVIDLETGKQLWADKGSKKRAAAYPVGVDGDRVIAVSDGAGDAGQAEVYTFGLRDGAREFAGRVRGAPKTISGVDVSCEDAWWQDGTLYLRDVRGQSGDGRVVRAFRFG